MHQILALETLNAAGFARRETEKTGRSPLEYGRDFGIEWSRLPILIPNISDGRGRHKRGPQRYGGTNADPQRRADSRTGHLVNHTRW